LQGTQVRNLHLGTEQVAERLRDETEGSSEGLEHALPEGMFGGAEVFLIEVAELLDEVLATHFHPQFSLRDIHLWVLEGELLVQPVQKVFTVGDLGDGDTLGGCPAGVDDVVAVHLLRGYSVFHVGIFPP
jgi:hypothetical protein